MASSSWSQYYNYNFVLIIRNLKGSNGGKRGGFFRIQAKIFSVILYDLSTLGRGYEKERKIRNNIFREFC